MNSYLLIGISLCGLSVIFGAFGAHLFKDILLEGEKPTNIIYDKAVLYQIFHSLAIILTFIIGKTMKINLDLCMIMFISGILFFSGSLYIYSLSKIQWFVHITPIGGTLLMCGWISLFIKIISIKN